MAEPVLPESITDGQISHEPHHEALHAWHNTHINPATGDLYTPDDFVGGSVGATGPTGATGPAGIASSTIAPGVAGVVGDGVADDTVAIQAILTAALAGTRVDVAKGTYKLSDQGAGFCLDISTKNSIHLVGPSSGRANPSAVGGGATFFSSSIGTTIFKCEAAALSHFGPFLENLRIEDRGGNAICFSLKDFNNYTFRSVTFKGNAGSTTGIGLKIVGTADASYGHVQTCGFHRHLIGMQMSISAGATIDGECYFNSTTVNHVLLDLAGGAAWVNVVGNKFEGTSTAGGIGIRATIGACSIVSNGFEQCLTGVSLVDPGSATYTGTSIVANHFTGGGGGGGGTAVVVGANRIRDELISNRYSGLTTNITDNGTDTLIIGTRTDAARTGEFMRVGGKYFGQGTIAPPAITVPDASMWYGNLGAYSRYAGAWNLLRPVVPVVSNPVSGGQILGNIVAKQIVYAADGTTVVGYLPVYDQITGVSYPQIVGVASTNLTGLANIIGPAGGLDVPAAVGEWLVLCIGFESTSTPTVTISDTSSNTWTIDRADDSTSGVGPHSLIASSKITTPIATTTNLPITVHFASNVNYPVMQVIHLTGMPSSAWADQAGGATGSSTSPSSGNITTTTDGELLIGTVFYNVIPTFTKESGWTLLNTQAAGNFSTLSTEFRFADIGTYAATATLGASQPWAASLVSYKKS